MFLKFQPINGKALGDKELKFVFPILKSTAKSVQTTAEV